MYTFFGGREKRSNERLEQQVSYIKHRCNESAPIQQQTMDDSDSYVSDSDSEFSSMQQKKEYNRTIVSLQVYAVTDRTRSQKVL